MSLVSSRTERLVEKLENRDIDALLVSDIFNVRYLTGFTGTTGLCLIGSGTEHFITDFRYREQARAQVKGLDIVIGERDPYESIGRLLAGANTTRLGLDHEKIPVSRYESLQDSLSDGVELVQAGGMVEDLREVKDEQELDAIGRAAALADEYTLRLLIRALSGEAREKSLGN